jgi:hypothetical protein
MVGFDGAARAPGARTGLLGWSLAIGILALVGAGFYSQFEIPFLPSRLGDRAGLVVGALGALATAIAAFNGILSPANPRVAATFDRTPWLKNTALRVPVLALTAFVVAYTMATDDFGIWTAAVGREGRQAMVIDRWRSAGRQTCAGFVVRGLSWLAPTRGLCADDRFKTFAVPGHPIVLTGRTSPLGIDVERFTVGQQP